MLSRRNFLKQAQATGLFFAGFSALTPARTATANAGLELMPAQGGLLDLPRGFSYRLVSQSGDRMTDGFFRPGRPDGMACFAFPGDANKCILMRNHENWPDTQTGSPFGDDNRLLRRLDDDLVYGLKPDGSPFFGGVTKVVYDLRSGEMIEDFLVLTGTSGNCAGGPTPWGSWLSCEEGPRRPPQESQRYHGFVFETPANATGVIPPVALTDMGRFAHEAAAVDPDSGIVYLTEDNRAGLFYRFLPNRPGALAEGGRLQALVISGQPGLNTSNWPREWGGGGLGSVPVGQPMDVEWIDLEDVEAPDADLAQRGHAAGAAQFFRGEGIVFGQRPGAAGGELFFNCTQGGAQRTGQVWRLTPARSEAERDRLTLIYESPGADTLDACDNIAIAPWGDLILCEDGAANQYLRGLTPDGRIYDLARNAHPDRSEFCGACFSPDGQTMFVNIQEPGYTLAIRGPWESLRG